MELESLRREYLMAGLEHDDLASSPFDQFERWMEQVITLQQPDPTAMTIATVSADGQPSQRIVLLKSFDKDGFVFYSNYNSRKGQELAQNPKISAHFPWHCVERQVRISGVAERISAAQSSKYFASRPRGSQVAAVASQQSEVLSSRGVLLSEYEALTQKFQAGEIPFPDFWGGYRINPTEFEFWQGGADRLHDRFRYLKTAESSWQIDRLAP
ncbi:MAG: pyridoxamine 5'-phosphate oxidase [Pseudohongiellaceae bacterium]|jgi:pyridoxamine 5'-phosphate oxidase